MSSGANGTGAVAIAADVAIVGAGPAGCAAAITLARAGRDVVMLDKARFPRDKCCGDGLTTGALRRLEALGLDPVSVPSWEAVDDVWVRSPSGRTVAFPLPRGAGTYAAVARRAELDSALVDVARCAGVRVVEGAALTSAADHGEGIVLTFDGIGAVSARYAIGADGMWSPLRKALGGREKRPYLGEWHAFRQYFSETGPEARKLWIWFEPDLLPGYAWSFPLPNGRANVGYAILRQPEIPTKVMNQQWREILERPHIAAVLGPGATPESGHKAWPIPAAAGDVDLVAASGRVLFVGDAARVADPMTGEGIGQALETGAMAAQSIISAGPLAPARAGREYSAHVAATLDTDNRFARQLSKIVAKPLGIRGAVRLAGQSAWSRANFGRWLFEDYPRAILRTPHRWGRGLLSRPGAYQG